MAEDEMEDYGSLEGWSERLGVPIEELQKRLAGVQGMTGRTADGQVLDFYSETDVRRVCSEFFK